MANTPDDNLPLYWKTVLDTLRDALLIVSPDGRIISVNKAAEEITGYTSRELTGSTCRMLDCTGCKLFAKGPGPQWCQLFSEGKVVAKRCSITTKSGEKLEVLKKASVLCGEDGEILGAVETLTDLSEVLEKERVILSLRRSLAYEEGFHGILGASPGMQRLFALIENTAVSQAPVLIQGESGTGKELVARAIHRLGHRSRKPFIKVNCAALNQNLLETELFGHVKGAFTGADRDRVGRFESAHQGDIFLDEIGDVPLPTQVKLLRVLEEKEVERVGDHRPIKVDVRFITATNRDLNLLLERGRFREDFFYRINVVPIVVPPLRERREDIPLLARAFVDRLVEKTGKPIGGLTRQAMDILYNHPWPGNVRELKNAIEYAFVLCHEGSIDRSHLPDRVLGQARASRPAPRGAARGDSGREELIRVLKQCRGNQSEAARRLGVSRMTVYKRIKKFGIDIKKDIA